MDYDRNMKYFTGVGYGLPIILFIVGVFTIKNGIGILLIIAGVIVSVKNKGKQVTDEEYDNACSSYCATLRPRALEKLGVDEDEVREITPIILEGYCYPGYDSAFCIQGKDEKWRTDKYQSTQLFFSANEVHIYRNEFCTVEEKKKESTEVYFYKDIVSVSTSSEMIKLNNNDSKKKSALGDEEVEIESFKLVTTGGTSLKVAIRDPEYAQRSINAMRQLLRAKKTA